MSEFQFMPTPEQKKALEVVLDELKDTPGALMSMLQRAQGIFGYLPEEVQKIVADAARVPVEEVYGVITFYSQFRTVPQGKYTVGVCLGTACYVKGAGNIFDKFKDELKIGQGGTTLDRNFTLEATRCIGCCGLAPVITVNEEVYGKLTANDVTGIIKKYRT